MLTDISANIERIARARGRIAALGTDYADGVQIPPHVHSRDQLLHALSGVVLVSAAAGRWIVPPEHALWLPAGCEHEVEMLGDVRMRSVYAQPDAVAGRAAQPRVLAMTPLVRALMVEAVALGDCADEGPRARLLTDLLLQEIPRLTEQPLALPLPGDRRLLRLCRGFIARPDTRAPLDDWAVQAGMSRRSLSRRFRQDTGLTLEQWRQQACVFAALPRLIDGVAVTTVALDLGYDSPAAFTTMFRRMLGRTPRSYLRGGV